MIFAPKKTHSKAKREHMNKYGENKEIIKEYSSKDTGQGPIIKP